ncbi:hypothetical protein PABY_13560 [Pyrodictium abyssi]|uniref:Secreted protein n=1 Tax=Pyrodictium abyssi TaxID=54256 RepID=A0ABM8IW50_9CREN|nr:hypothetical protein PABY_13560 [Pyrodictium abyssi]
MRLSSHAVISILSFARSRGNSYPERDSYRTTQYFYPGGYALRRPRKGPGQTGRKTTGGAGVF